MSRWIQFSEDERGVFYVEALCNASECRWLINEVCCNGENRDMVGDFPFREDCKRCIYFESEPNETLEALQKGIKTYEEMEK